jgi:hypothetical protein
MNKRGQLAIIIIIAVVITLIILTVVFLREGTNNLDDFPDGKKIINEMDNCLQRNLETAIQLIGLGGGYIQQPPQKLETDIGSITYSYKSDRNILQTIKKMNEEIVVYLRATTISCIDESDYLNLELEISIKDIEIAIKDEKIESNIRIDYAMKNEATSQTITNEHKTNLNINLKSIQETTNQIILNHQQDPNSIDITYLTSTPFKISFVPYENSIIYTITDDNSKINDISYSFIFAIEK